MGYMKVLKSGRLLEIYRYEKDLPQKTLFGQSRPRKKNRSKRPRGSERRRGDNLLRLKRGFIRLVRANLGGDVHPSFITLTFERDVPLRDAFTCLSGFARKMRENYGSAYRYIAVPEFQKRGTVHFHLLAWGVPTEVILNERFNRTLQGFWSLGFVDCITTDGSPKLAGYIGKYMYKGMLDDRLRNERAYICSRGIMRSVSLPGIALSYICEDEGLDLSTATPLQDRTFETQWLGVGRYTSYKLD